MTSGKTYKKVRKAILPVAGLGTRFLPATKAIPKEMLPIVDRPLIQYIVDEAIDAGIEDFVLVTGRNKNVIEDHFDVQFELEMTLQARNKTALLRHIRNDLLKPGQMSYIRQQLPIGLGHAIWCARNVVGNEPFAVLLPDVICHSEMGCLKQMQNIYQETGGNIIAVEEVPQEETSKYGVVENGKSLNEDGSAFEILGMVEKPALKDSPSNLIISGRYILQPDIFQALADQEPGKGDEIQLTDAMLAMIQTQSFTGLKYDGVTFDCGSKEGFILANVAHAIQRKDLDSDDLKHKLMNLIVSKDEPSAKSDNKRTSIKTTR